MSCTCARLRPALRGLYPCETCEARRIPDAQDARDNTDTEE
jgi:hypothetical protein